MDLIVEKLDGDWSARLGARVWRCAVGRSGVAATKREGDGATPTGRWTMRHLLYRADRLAAPRTRLETAAIADDDGWCDAPGHAAYNRPVKLPFQASHERLWRDDPLYDLVVVLGHNDDPPLGDLGSCIFLHVARPDYGPTEGCVALARDDLIELLALVEPGCGIEVREPVSGRAAAE